MRKHSLVLLTMLAALTAFAPFAAAQTDEKTVRRELKEWYGKAVDAYKRKDAKAHASLFTPDIKMVSWDGKKIVGRQALREYTRQDMATIQTLHSAREVIDKITIKGQKAVREGTETWKYKMLDTDGTYGAKGKLYENVVWKQRGRSTFVKTAAGWLLKSGSIIGKPELTVGGKPLRPLK